MASVKDHYDAHLAPLYTWISGGASGPRQRFADLLTHLGLSTPKPGETAIDLGAGSGFQTIPLAQAGYTVTAIDVSEVLLAELANEAAGFSVRCVLCAPLHFFALPSGTTPTR